MPIKGIQIASVNIPIITSSGGGGNVGSLQGNTVMTIPVVSKPNEVTRHTVNQSSMGGAPTIITMAQAGSAQSSATVRGLLANVIQKQGNIQSSSGVNMHAVVQLPQTGNQLPNGHVSFYVNCRVFILELTGLLSWTGCPAVSSRRGNEAERSDSKKPGDASAVAEYVETGGCPLLCSVPKISPIYVAGARF